MSEWVDPEPLHSAAQCGDVVRLRELVDLGHSVNAFDELGFTPLHYAVWKDQFDAAMFLIKAGADVNASDSRCIGNTPLREVAGSCSLKMATLLVESGADPTIRGWMQLSALDLAEERMRGDGPKVYELLLAATKTRRA
jgi:ankyrin repeat protein